MEIFKIKYNCIFSLGADCATAEALTKCKLRYFSSPFDWLYGGDFKARINFLLNDFEKFLNKGTLEKTGSREVPEKTDIYLNKETNISFMHDFPKDVPLEKSFNLVKEKFDRRIKNLNNRIKNSKNTLIVFGAYQDKKTNTNFDVIQDLVEKTNAHYNKNTIDILYICGKKDIQPDKFLIEKFSDNLYIAEVYIDNKDAVKSYKRLLSKIKIKKHFKDLVLKITKTNSRTRIYLFGIKIMSLKNKKFSY